MNTLAFIDACQKFGLSTHCWALRNEKGKYFKRHTTKGEEETPILAEINTLDRLVKYLEKKDYEDVMIFTDSKNMIAEIMAVIHGEESEFKSRLNPIIHSMKMLGLQIKYANRESDGIKFVDKYASELMDTIINRENSKPSNDTELYYNGLSRRDDKKMNKYGDVIHIIPHRKQVKRHVKKYKKNAEIVKLAVKIQNEGA